MKFMWKIANLCDKLYFPGLFARFTCPLFTKPCFWIVQTCGSDFLIPFVLNENEVAKEQNVPETSLSFCLSLWITESLCFHWTLPNQDSVLQSSKRKYPGLTSSDLGWTAKLKTQHVYSHWFLWPCAFFIHCQIATYLYLRCSGFCIVLRESRASSICWLTAL